MPAGRISDYSVDFCQIAHSMAQNGATNREIADALECDETTLYRWMAKHEELRQSMKLGKDAADDRVENALYHRALGYSHPAVKIMQHEGEVIVEEYIEHYPPDTAAASLWLRNRRPGQWREKSELEHHGRVSIGEFLDKI